MHRIRQADLCEAVKDIFRIVEGLGCLISRFVVREFGNISGRKDCGDARIVMDLLLIRVRSIVKILQQMQVPSESEKTSRRNKRKLDLSARI